MKIVTRSSSFKSLFNLIPGARYHLVLLILAVCSFMSGCAAQQGNSAGLDIEIKRDVIASAANSTVEPESGYNTKIATLLVGTLSQLPGFEPLSITVQITPPETVFGEAIAQAMRDAGYGLQRVADDQGRNYISYARTEITSDIGFIVEYSLAVADVVIYRKFSLGENDITPVSPLTITGVEPQYIHMYHDLFVPDEANLAFTRNVLFELNNGQQVTYLPDADTQLEPISRRRSVTSLIEMNNAEIIEINDYAPVKEVVVEFPTADSKYLGERNKQLIRAIVDGYTARLNVFTLEGCIGHGERGNKSASPPGYALLWQKRVKDELMSAGVAKKSIRVTACSGQYRQRALPERAVIITLRRLKTAS